MKIKRAIVLLLVAVGLFSFSFGWRLGDAQANGDIWLAFKQDSFMGFPVTHITALVGAGFLFAGMLSFASKTQQQSKEAKTE